MENIKQTTKEYFKIISTIHLAMFMGQLILGLLIYFFIIDPDHPDLTSELAQILQFLVPSVAIVGIIASRMIFKKRLIPIKEDAELKIKMEKYREALIIRMALLEGSALFSMVAVFITNNVNYLIYACCLVVYFIYNKPTLTSAISNLELNQMEISKLEDPETLF